MFSKLPILDNSESSLVNERGGDKWHMLRVLTSQKFA